MIEEKEKRELRRQWAYDLRNVLDLRDGSEMAKRINDLVREAEAAVTELDDPEAAERIRRINTDF